MRQVATIVSMSVLKEQAEVLRVRLVAGVCTAGDAVEWADRLIAAQERPDTSLLNISLSGSRSAAEMSTLLAAVPGDCDRVEVMRGVLAESLSVAEREPSRADDIARWLYLWSVNGDLPEQHFGREANALDDTFDLARQTIIPRDEAMAQLLAFLRRSSRPAT